MDEETYEETYDVDVQLANGERVSARLIANDLVPENHDFVKLTLEFAGKEISRTDRSYFEAMRNIRQELEQAGALLCCYGASLNVYPSGMSMDMGGGSKAYKTTLGSQGRLADLVSIFDSGPDVRPATVAEQKEFHKRWMESIGATGSFVPPQVAEQSAKKNREPSKDDLELWRKYLAAFHGHEKARGDLFRQDCPLRELIRAGLDSPHERAAALKLVRWLDLEDRKQLLPDLLSIASYLNGLTAFAQDLIIGLPRSWLLAHIEEAVEPLLREGTEEDYGGILSLYLHLDRTLTIKLARRAVANADPEIKEVGEHFLDKLGER